MFEVIEGKAAIRPEAEQAPRDTARKPYDWSNIVFAPGYIERAKGEHEARLAS